MNPILIVDDEAAIAMLVRRILTEAGYRCQAVTDSREAADLLEKNRYDLVLLDVMMPHLDGYDLLAYLRPTGTPCIFITAKDAVAERVRGLNSGADDYIVKPFAPTELVARVESVLRRAGRSTAVYTMWEYTVDAAACRVLRGEEEMHLTRKEYDLLLLFLRNRGRALYRDYLYETVWGDDGTGCDTRTLDTHIARLRRKLNLGDRKIVLFVGRLIPEKGAGLLAQAVAQLPGVVLVAAGSGPQQQELADLGAVTPGALPHDAVVQLLRQADVYCLPTRYAEGFPTTLLEAAACRCPIVCTRTAGTEELLPDDTHGIVLPGQPQDATVETIRAGLQTLLDDPARAHACAEAAYRNVYAHFTWDAVFDKMMGIINQS